MLLPGRPFSWRRRPELKSGMTANTLDATFSEEFHFEAYHKPKVGQTGSAGLQWERPPRHLSIWSSPEQALSYALRNFWLTPLVSQSFFRSRLL